MAWWQWGDEDAAHVVVCVHGLTRQGRDFDVLARSLVSQAQAAGRSLAVVCPDIVGRGKSDWLPDPDAYQLPTYAVDLLQLLTQLAAGRPDRFFDWVGTSMGGLIALAASGYLAPMAASPASTGALQSAPDGTPSDPAVQAAAPAPRLRRLLLNDVGPAIQWAALQRIGSYLGVPGVQFQTPEEGAAYLHGVSPGFGPCTDEQWLALSLPMLAQAEDTSWRLHYDPAIAQAFRDMTPAAGEQGEALLWALYDRIQVPTLVMRGEDSDLLSHDAALQMTQRGPRATLFTCKGAGHALTLVSDDQLQVVSRFLLDD